MHRLPLRSALACVLLLALAPAAWAQPTPAAEILDASGVRRFLLTTDGDLALTGDWFGSGVGGVPVTGVGSRLMWVPLRGAFRAGVVLGGYPRNEDNLPIIYTNATEWDAANVGTYSVAMGLDTRASGEGAFAVGVASYATGPRAIAMGEGVTASGGYSVALGYRANTSARSGSFVFGDRSSVDQTPATANNQATWRTAGGFRIYTTSNRIAGTELLPGGTSWQVISDSTKKERFRAYSPDAVLAGLARLRIGTWNYRGQDPATQRHWGPMAQDFAREFGHDGVGRVGTDTSIATQDADGVLFAAAQALEARTRALAAENAALRARLDRLEAARAPSPVEAAFPVAGVAALLGLVGGVRRWRRKA